ncbi:hypothetical protein BEL04_06450 [Mucilaginibacter sp. PPCGB 2223]|uniref:universal stress protein n=1 Tax=Mucilaginibacter sp. PPCGB 2223 TaxID=1886027 RepID=UPI000823FDC9|nr:universal stress protein [Mucilaginibacter sp. PPCGB 2223]OCX53916.1 hypothetical protein BEL04_06450 [Mucilaginibacter sp. PPCGB 2223]
MKKILALTDLSENSAHAARFASMLAGQMKKGLILYHSYAVLPVIPSYAGAPWVARDIVYAAKQRKAHLEDLAEQLSAVPGIGSPAKIETSSDEGSLVTNVKKLIKQNDIEMIVMGAASGSRIDHFLNGRDTLAIISTCPCPVLVIPRAAEPKPIWKIIFATALHDRDIAAASYLVNLARVLGAHLEIVHMLPLAGGETEEWQEARFMHLLENFKYPLITYHRMRAKSISAHLQHEGKEYGADTLALIHYHHGFLTGLFAHGTIRQLLAHHNLPVLVLPAEMELESPD